jgi:hypothetical protein
MGKQIFLRRRKPLTVEVTIALSIAGRLQIFDSKVASASDL